MCSKIVTKHQSCLISLDWMDSYYKAKESESVLIIHNPFKSVNSDCAVFSRLYIPFCASFLNACVVFRSRKWIIWSAVLWQWHSWWKSSGQCAPAANVGPVSAQSVVLTPQQQIWNPVSIYQDLLTWEDGPESWYHNDIRRQILVLIDQRIS